MNFLSTALHGSTTMVSILIGQILVVASLAMMMIWLLVKRARFGPPADMAFGGAHFVGISSVDRTGIPTHAPVVNDQTGTIIELEKKCADLAIENKNLQGMKSEYNSLQEKIKFLESKLLEYEILQEEIGTLSMLKLENEKLKKEISKLQAEIDSRIRGRSAPLEEAEPPVVAAPQAIATPEPENNEDIEPTAAPRAVVSAPVEPAGTVAPAAVAAATDPGGLDGLLSEIEALTAEAGKENPPKA